MEHLHWPVPVESLLGEVVGYICDECYDTCKHEAAETQYNGETWKLFWPDNGGFIMDDTLLMRNRAGNVLRTLLDSHL